MPVKVPKVKQLMRICSLANTRCKSHVYIVDRCCVLGVPNGTAIEEQIASNSDLYEQASAPFYL